MNCIEVFGICQDNLAMLLKVTRSQLGMYLVGKRDLPIDAKLTQMLRFTMKNNFNNKMPINKTEKLKTIKWLTEEKKINSKKQQTTIRKIIFLEKNKKNAQSALKFVMFLKQQDKNAAEETLSLLQLIELNAKTVLEKNNLELKTALELKLETLKAEEKLIIKKMKKLV